MCRWADVPRWDTVTVWTTRVGQLRKDRPESLRRGQIFWRDLCLERWMITSHYCTVNESRLSTLMQLLFSFDQNTRVDETLIQSLAYQLSFLPPISFVNEFVFGVPISKAFGATGLWDCPVACEILCTHICLSISSSVENVTLFPSFTQQKKYLPPTCSSSEEERNSQCTSLPRLRPGVPFLQYTLVVWGRLYERRLA